MLRHVFDGLAVDEGGDEPMVAVGDAAPIVKDDDRGVGVGLPDAGLDVVEHEPYFEQIDLALMRVSDPPACIIGCDSADTHRCLAIHLGRFL